jgi:hypothetical protein
MDILLQDFLRRFSREVTPLLNWAVTHSAITLVVLTLALVWCYKGKFHK